MAWQNWSAYTSPEGFGSPAPPATRQAWGRFSAASAQTWTHLCGGGGPGLQRHMLIVRRAASTRSCGTTP
eukprot:13755118-Ditylum_brightwellii.AAC.1